MLGIIDSSTFNVQETSVGSYQDMGSGYGLLTECGRNVRPWLTTDLRCGVGETSVHILLEAGDARPGNHKLPEYCLSIGPLISHEKPDHFFYDEKNNSG